MKKKFKKGEIVSGTGFYNIHKKVVKQAETKGLVELRQTSQSEDGRVIFSHYYALCDFEIETKFNVLTNAT